MHCAADRDRDAADTLEHDRDVGGVARDRRHRRGGDVGRLAAVGGCAARRHHEHSAGAALQVRRAAETRY